MFVFSFSKCPLKSCALGGRKKAKPSRTIPDTANSLDLERRRFIIHHRKLHPEAIKCCGSCIRKIQNDFADVSLNLFFPPILLNHNIFL